MIGVNFLAFRDEERRAAELLDYNLGSLHHLTSLFGQALKLADYCDAEREPFRLLSLEATDWDDARRASGINDQFNQWKMLAIRDGAITLYNFAEGKQALEKLIGHCPSVKEKLDKDAYSEAGRLWEEAFPGYNHVRLDVAHSGKLFNAPGKRELHTMPGTEILLRSFVSGRTFTTSINGKMASYSLTSASADALETIKEAVYRGYEPISRFSRSLPPIHEPETPQPPAEG